MAVLMRFNGGGDDFLDLESILEVRHILVTLTNGVHEKARADWLRLVKLEKSLDERRRFVVLRSQMCWNREIRHALLPLACAPHIVSLPGKSCFQCTRLTKDRRLLPQTWFTDEGDGGDMNCAVGAIFKLNQQHGRVIGGDKRPVLCS